MLATTLSVFHTDWALGKKMPARGTPPVEAATCIFLAVVSARMTRPTAPEILTSYQADSSLGISTKRESVMSKYSTVFNHGNDTDPETSEMRVTLAPSSHTFVKAEKVTVAS